MKFYKQVIVALICSASFNITAQAAEAFKLINKQVSENFYLITSNNKSNITHVGVVVGENGILLVDSYFESKAEDLYKAIKEISDKPLKYVINTHSHPDHAGGNKYFAEQGAVIISQDNSRFSEAYGQLRFKDSIKIDLGNEVMTAAHVVSHTYDDAIIYLEESNVIFMGDNLSTHTFLSIGEKGLAGHLQAFDTAISMANDETIVIPAHAAFNDAGVSTLKKKDLYAYKVKFTAWVDRLKKLHNSDTSVANMVKDEELRAHTLAIAVDGHKDSGRKMIEGPGFEQTIGIAIKALFSKKHNLSEIQLNKYVGTFESTSGHKTEITTNNGKLFIREYGQFLAELLPLTEEKFLLKGYFYGIGEGKEMIDFELNNAGIAIALTPSINNESPWKSQFNIERRAKL